MNAYGIIQIEPFVPGNNFISYENRLQQYYQINNIKDQHKSALLTIILGSNVYETLKLLTAPHLPASIPFDDLIRKLRQYFHPKLQSKQICRFKFFSIRQGPNESIRNYALRLKCSIQSCHFGDYIHRPVPGDIRIKAINDKLIDQFIFGLKNKNTRELLLNLTDDNIDFKKCYRFAEINELLDGEDNLDCWYKQFEPSDLKLIKHVHWNDNNVKCNQKFSFRY